MSNIVWDANNGWHDGEEFALSETERACGITLEHVRCERARALVQQDGTGTRVIVSADASPALAGAVARMALGGAAEFVGMASGMPVYRIRD